MTDDQAALAGYGGTARLFPLPNLVLFPGVVQGLHIFEPRYRQMTADALAGDQLLVPVLLKPGWEDDYDHAPEIESVGCLARITHHELLPDGRSNLRVRGLVRLRLTENAVSGKPYRTARGEPVADVAPADLPRLGELRRLLATAVLQRFEPSGPAHRHLRDLFDGDLPLGPLCDLLAYALPIPLELKQQLLEEPHADLRAETLAHAIDLPAETGGRRFPPDFSPN